MSTLASRMAHLEREMAPMSIGLSLSLRRKLALAAVVLICAVATQGIVAYRVLHDRSVAADWLEHSHLRLAMASDAGAAIDDMEAGYATFMMTGRDASLAPHHAGTARYAEIIEALSESAESPRADWLSVIAGVKAWRTDIVEPGIALRREVSRGKQTAAAVVSHANAAGDEGHLATVRTQFSKAQAAEERLLVDREKRHAAASDLVSWIFGLSAGLGLLVALIVSWWMTRSLGRPLALIAERARLVSEGEVDVEKLGITGTDELARLGQTFDGMVESLSTLNAQARAIAAGQLDDPLLGQALPGKLGDSMQRMVNNVQSAATAIDQVSRGDLELTSFSPRGEGDALGTSIERLVGALREQRGSLKREHDAREHLVERQFLEARLSRAFDMAQTETDAVHVVGRVLSAQLSDRSAELLLAGGTDAALRRVADNGSTSGCSVDCSSNCPAIRRGQTLNFPLSSAFDACPWLLKREDALAATCVPVSVMGQALGVLHTTTPATDLPDEPGTALLEQVALRAGDRIGVLRAFARSEELASTDPLTGLINRRSLETAVARLEAEHTTYALVYADIDHFKRLNDEHGHDIGDAALQIFAAALNQALRPVDFPARWGGEEFVIVLPGCDAQDAVGALERVGTRLAEQLGSSTLPHYTVSYGVAQREDFAHFDHALSAADGALLRAKNAGRDRIVIHGDVDETTLRKTA